MNLSFFLQDGFLQSQEDINTSIMIIVDQWAKLRSKDPNTKVGAGVYDPVTGALFLGYNGFPSKFPDSKSLWCNRDKNSLFNKYEFVIHAEANAIRKALMALGDQVSRCHLYVTHYPCHRCLVDFIIPNQIKTIFFSSYYPEDVLSQQLISYYQIKAIHFPINIIYETNNQNQISKKENSTTL